MGSKDIIGGQAVIEGVMMLNNSKVAIAVRRPDNSISIKRLNLRFQNSIFLKLPIIRGVSRLFMMMAVGLRALNYSASESMDEEEEELSSWMLGLTIIISMIAGLALFKFLPLLLASIIQNKLNLDNYILFNVSDGLIKIGIFVGYVYLISFFKDIRRLFQYHGAEHKAVYCAESNLALTVKNVKKFSTLHPRCGTSFVLGGLIISIAVYTFIPSGTSFLGKFLLRILLLPVIAGISYEILRWSSRNVQNPVFKAITKPGLWLQRITTKEPDNKQIEVAIKALKAVR